MQGRRVEPPSLVSTPLLTQAHAQWERVRGKWGGRRTVTRQRLVAWPYARRKRSTAWSANVRLSRALGAVWQEAKARASTAAAGSFPGGLPSDAEPSAQPPPARPAELLDTRLGERQLSFQVADALL